MQERKARNTIRNIEENAVCISNNQSIVQLFLTRYSLLFNQQVNTQPIPLAIQLNTISEEENHRLCALATMEEIHLVVSRLNPNSALGIDGFNEAFYRATWSTIAYDLLDAVNNFLRSGKMLAEVNHTLLCLIPKKAIPATVDDYRPIALCNVLSKILSKTLANRLKPLLPKLIDFNQSAFINGGRISNSILLAQELCHKLHMSQGHARMCLKLDLRKAFDSHNRQFLCNTLRCLGFHDTWVG